MENIIIGTSITARYPRPPDVHSVQSCYSRRGLTSRTSSGVLSPTYRGRPLTAYGQSMAQPVITLPTNHDFHVCTSVISMALRGNILRRGSRGDSNPGLCFVIYTPLS